jgi:hypothetical protein
VYIDRTTGEYQKGTGQMYHGLIDTQDTEVVIGDTLITLRRTRSTHDHKTTSGWDYLVHDMTRRNWLDGYYCTGAGRALYRDDAIAMALA